jgi:hypothetical protein
MKRHKKFSVLLLYPDDLNEGGHQTYYSHVCAIDVDDAIRVAQLEASVANGSAWEKSDDPTTARDELARDFKQLLVIAGHHADLGNGH